MKFVVAGYGSRGDTEPCIAVAEELLRRGHEVRMALTVPENLRAYVGSAGLSTEPYGRDWQELLGDQDFTRMLQDPVSALPQAVEYVTRVGAEKMATLRSLADGADLLVAGMTEQQAAADVTEHCRIPLVALHFFPPEILGEKSIQPPISMLPLEIQAYDAICIPGLAAGWAAGANRRPFVGALTLNVPTGADDESLAWIARGSAPVYFGFGSMPIAVPADIVAAITMACEQVDTRALICLGPNYCDATTESERVKVVREVNHAAIFPACRAVVHHGGAGTTAAALRAGVPNLVLWSGLDQPVWAASVAYLNVGIGRRFSESNLASLTADLRALLTPHYTAHARDIAAKMTTPHQSLSHATDLIIEAASSGHG